MIPAVALIVLSSAASADGLEEHFGGSFPPSGGMVADSASSGVVWKSNAEWDQVNWTGGGGTCAACNPNAAAGVDYDTWLISPVFEVPENARLYFRMNYQNMAGWDFLDIEVFIGMSWYTILRLNEDHGAFLALPGEWGIAEFPGMVGPGVEVKIGFHYHDDVTSPDDDWYAQIDDVIISDGSPVHGGTWGAIKALYR